MTELKTLADLIDLLCHHSHNELNAMAGQEFTIPAFDYVEKGGIYCAWGDSDDPDAEFGCTAPWPTKTRSGKWVMVAGDPCATDCLKYHPHLEHESLGYWANGGDVPGHEAVDFFADSYAPFVRFNADGSYFNP